MEEFEHLSLSRTVTIEQSSGYNLFDIPLALSPPLAPATTPATSPPPAPLASPAPAPSPSPEPPARRSSRMWTPREVLAVVALHRKFGNQFRRIARLTLRTEGAVRGILVRRGFLPPPQKRLKPAAPQARWTAEEDRALLAAIETTPRRERGGGFRWKEIARRAGLNRPAHAARNRAGRLALEG